ncbi:MAG: DMT family transporter [Actinomycetota bacterium]
MGVADRATGGELADTVTRRGGIDKAVVLFLTPVLWGATFPAAKLALDDLDPFAFMAWTRILGLVTIVAALPWMARRSENPLELKRSLWPGLVLGALLFLGYSLQTVGLDLTTATNAGFITGLYVVFTPVLGLVLFRIPVRPSLWGAVAVSFVGLALLSTATLRTFRPHLGDVLVLASALAWSGHVTALGRFAPRYPAPLLSVAQMVAASLFHLAAALTSGLQTRAAVATLPLLFITGVLGTGVAYTLQIVAQRDITPARAAVILSGESLFSALLSTLWIGERLVVHQWLGALLIVVAMVLSETGARRDARQPTLP